MRRLCKYCGAEYDGDPGGSCCPDCAFDQRRTSVRDRVCTRCGVVFPGGPAARYCPDCRRERKSETNRQYRERLAAGNVRTIGSTSICEVCGLPYIVEGGLQKYCPKCAPEAVRQIDRAASRRWSADNVTPEQRREERQAASAPVRCDVCGRLFVPSDSSRTCSAECSAELHRRQAAQWERDHRQERNQYHNDRLRAKLDAMTPEELQAYREKVNARARKNYKKRKEKENKK